MTYYKGRHGALAPLAQRRTPLRAAHREARQLERDIAFFGSDPAVLRTGFRASGQSHAHYRRVAAGKGQP